MKFLIPVYYAIRSVLLRGPLASWRMWRAEQEGDKQLGINTVGFIKSHSRAYYHYQGASYLVLERIFGKLTELTAIRSLTDIGSGMGRVIFFAEQKGFSELKGIELDKDLVNQANQNQINGKKARTGARIEFLHSNALEHRFENSSCIYFMFNPFDAYVLESVIRQIKDENKKEFYLVYMNPVHKRVLKKSGLREVYRLRTGFYLEAIFYTG